VQVGDQLTRTGVFLADDVPFNEANPNNFPGLLSAESDSATTQAQHDTQGE
jgi:hypothetical protein